LGGGVLALILTFSLIEVLLQFVPSTLRRPFRPGNFADYISKHLPIAAMLWWRLEPSD